MLGERRKKSVKASSGACGDSGGEVKLRNYKFLIYTFKWAI